MGSVLSSQQGSTGEDSNAPTIVGGEPVFKQRPHRARGSVSKKNMESSGTNVLDISQDLGGILSPQEQKIEVLSKRSDSRGSIQYSRPSLIHTPLKDHNSLGNTSDDVSSSSIVVNDWTEDNSVPVSDPAEPPLPNLNNTF